MGQPDPHALAHPPRRRALWLVAMGLTGLGTLGRSPLAWAQAKPGTLAFPLVRQDQAVQGLHRHVQLPAAARLVAAAQAQQAAAQALAAAAAGAQQAAARAQLRLAWQQARLAWIALATPALGPVLQRRSAREIDFWPTRPALLDKALAQAPCDLAALQAIGGPAKGFPAIEALLEAAPDPRHAPYLRLLADAILAEAQALHQDCLTLAAHDWANDEDATAKAFAEWINQWLAALEHLRWAQIEQPLQRAASARQTAGRATSLPPLARRQLGDNLADWQQQWQSLRQHARLELGPAQQAPEPGASLMPIEGLLMAKGHLRLAARWARAVEQTDAAWRRLPALPQQADVSGQQRWLAALPSVAATLKRLAALYQAEVAGALNVPLGFSSADGD